MNRIVDRLFVRIGFSENELEASEIRGRLYIGMIFLSGWTTAFLLMTVIDQFRAVPA